MLKSFVEIKFEISSIYKAQCAEENSPLKFPGCIKFRVFYYGKKKK